MTNKKLIIFYHEIMEHEIQMGHKNADDKHYKQM